MPEFIFIFMALGAVFGQPMITAAMARSTGRSYWKWFGIGCLLPVISVVILYFLPEEPKV